MANASNSPKGKDLMRPIKSVGVDFDDKPLWHHVKVISIAPNDSGNRTWSCNYCNKIVTRSYNIVKAHLLRLSGHGVHICKEIHADIFVALKLEHEQAEQKKSSIHVDARKKADYVSLPEGGDRFDIDGTTNGLSLIELSIDEPQIEGVVFEEEFEDLEEVEEDAEE
ncbi:uncharacterized protein LOC129875751 [Solanum dulcamara]|uniref:uncharacterized protein LOC129875751 n=1 Tax=Solanum dulcamara TaxID=45834 RepID=UPI00248577B5|nr:uncharacterized protein LOC129875751 [Solanum dulcamara]